MLERNFRNAANLNSASAVLVCWAATALILYLTGTPPAGPALFPDEVCRLGWARFLSGTGTHFDMSPASFCQPYYPVLLAPLNWLTADPATFYRGVFAINSLFAAASLPLAVLMSRRYFNMQTGWAWIAGLAIVTYPSLTLYSHHALPETLLFLAVLVAFALWCRWTESPSWQRFAGLLVMAFVLYALHRKMLIVPVALICGAAVGYWFNRTSSYRKRLLLTTLILASAFLLEKFAKTAFLPTDLPVAGRGAIDVLTRLTSIEQIRNSAGIAAGVMVYASLVSGGTIWLVATSNIVSFQRSLRDRLHRPGEFIQKSAFPLVFFALLAFVTAVYFGESKRFDIWFYGRHVDAAICAMLLPAIAVIARRRADGDCLRWAIALPALCLLVLSVTLPAPPWSDFSNFHVIGAGPVMDWMHQAPGRPLLLVWCAAILALSGIIFLARLRGRFRLMALAPLAIATLTTHLYTDPFRGVPIDLAFSESAAKALREAEPCHIYFDDRSGGRLRLHQYFRLQYYFPNCSIKIERIGTGLPPGSQVLTRKVFADCRPTTECHEVHPDMVLYRTPRQ